MKCSEISFGINISIDQESVITNSVEVINLLQQYNVKLVLQGHLLFPEDIYHNGISLCNRWRSLF